MYQVARAGLRIRMSQMHKTKDTCEPRSQHMHDTNTNQAVVLGASLAGLLAARVLSERFEQEVLDHVAEAEAGRFAPSSG